MCSADIFLGLLAILFPPLPVWVKTGICSADSLINLLLCLLGFIPGLIHAWYIIAKFPEPDHEYERVQQDAEGGRVTYVFVSADGRQHTQQQRLHGGPQPQKPMNYGATNNTAQHGGQPSHPENNGGEGRSDGPPPPSYAAVVSGDHKVQSQD